MIAWLTRAPPSIFTAFSRDFCYSSLEFYCSKTPLNIIEYFVLTGTRDRRRHRLPPWRPIYHGISICYALNVSSKHSCYITSNTKARRSRLRKPPGAPVWRVNMALTRIPAEAIDRSRYDGRAAPHQRDCPDYCTYYQAPSWLKDRDAMHGNRRVIQRAVIGAKFPLWPAGSARGDGAPERARKRY
jgi:hypothetical protein